MNDLRRLVYDFLRLPWQCRFELGRRFDAPIYRGDADDIDRKIMLHIKEQNKLPEFRQAVTAELKDLGWIEEREDIET